MNNSTEKKESFFKKFKKQFDTETVLIVFVLVYLVVGIVFTIRDGRVGNASRLIAAKQMQVVFDVEYSRNPGDNIKPNGSNLYKYIGNGTRRDPALQLVGFMTIDEKAEFGKILFENDTSYSGSYIESGYWKLKSDDYSYGIYYIKNDQSRVKYLNTANLPKSESQLSKRQPDADSLFFQSLRSEKLIQDEGEIVPFKYDIVSNELRIPINNNHLLAWRVFFSAVFGGWIAINFFLVWSFVRFLITIFSGKSFTAKNITRLKVMAYILLSLPVLSLIFGLLQPIIFSSRFTDDLVFNYEFLFSRNKTYFACLIFLVLLKTFKRGKLLQEEQDLTV